MKKFKLKMPTEKDWDDWSDDPPRDCVTEWNRGYAKQEFFGKTIEQVIPELKRNFMGYYDEFCDMPRRCFQYYIFAITEILKEFFESGSKEQRYSISDMASCFLSFLKDRAKNDPKSLKPIMNLIWPELERVANNQNKFYAPVDIYGDFRDNLAEIKKLCDENKIQ